MKFGENLKNIRKQKNISQEELAEKLGVSRQSISKWETGENFPSMNNIMCLCDIFKCKINDLVHEDFTDIDSLDSEIKESVVKFKKEKQIKVKLISKIIYVLANIINKIFIGVSVLISIICIAKVFECLYKLFFNIHNGDTPFTLENINCIKKISYFIIFYVVFSFIYGLMCGIIMKIDFKAGLELSDIVYALIIYSISFIFEYGYELQLDSKSKMYEN